MGRIDAVIPDELEKRFRLKAIEKFGGKKGSISEAMTIALREWTKK